MKSIRKWTVISAAVAVLAGGVWYASNVNAAREPGLKPLGAENQVYNLNPAPQLKSNVQEKEKILNQKEAILSKFKLGQNDKILSAELKTWSDYNAVNTVNGVEALNTTIANDRLVWVVDVSFPDGYDSRIGHYNTAKVTYVIDPESQEVVAKDVSGDLEKRTGGKFDPSWLENN